MAFDYSGGLAALLGVLRAANTTTAAADLSAGLTSRVDDHSIRAGDPDFSVIRGDRYPFLFVRLSSADEEFAGIGETGPRGAHKEKKVTYDIFGFYKREGVGSKREDLLDEVYHLASNIEAVLAANVRLGSTALWSNPRATAFANLPTDGGVWVKSVLIELEAVYHFR